MKKEDTLKMMFDGWRKHGKAHPGRYIDERFDHPPYFLPRNDPVKRAHVRIWSDFVTEKMQKTPGGQLGEFRGRSNLTLASIRFLSFTVTVESSEFGKLLRTYF